MRELGELLREHKHALADLVTIEAGKIRSEALGEVQEMIDICDLAVGLSRQLHGLTIASERPGHRMMEQWHPLGVVGVISAFNFPVAVWSWNAALAFVCGDAVVWKPSEKTLLTALACQALAVEAANRVGAPAAISSVLIGAGGGRRGAGRRPAGRARQRDRIDPHGPRDRAPGGRPVRPAAARTRRQQRRDRRARRPTSSLAVRGIVFSAAGTAGQRCTTLRRVIAHSSIIDELAEALTAAYTSLRIDSPLADGTLVGPLIDQRGLRRVRRRAADRAGRRRHACSSAGTGCSTTRRPTRTTSRRRSCGCRPRPRSCATETFGPILYLLELRRLRRGARAAQRGAAGPVVVDLHDGRARGRAVPGRRRLRLRHRQRQHRPVRRRDRRRVRRREGDRRRPRVRARTPGSNYMRRATNTVNYSTELPLAQGVEFG